MGCTVNVTVAAGAGSKVTWTFKGWKQVLDDNTQVDVPEDWVTKTTDTNGNVTNTHKSFMRGKSVVSFSLGTKDLYEYLDHNEDMYYMPFPIVNDKRIIAQNDHMISVNGAISIDLTGQVDADNIGGRQFSATGGQLDFVQGAQMSRGGASFIAATSENVNKKTGKKNSRIVAKFPEGTAVTTPRSEVNNVVTEYGCVNLKPMTMKQRAHALIGIAHPDFRDELTEQAKQMGLW